VVELLDRVEDGAARLRIDAHGGLVHKEQARLVQQPHPDVDAALHPAGIGLDALLGPVLETDLLEHLVDARGKRFAGKSVHISPEIEVLQRCKVLVERQFLRDDSDAVLDRHGLARDGMPADGGVAAGRGEEGGEYGDGGGLARAVGSEQAEDLALLDVKGNAFDRGEIGVFFYKVVHFKNGCHMDLLLNQFYYKNKRWIFNITL